MTAKEIIDHYGGIRAAGRALGLQHGTIRWWLKAKRVPPRRQYEIAWFTRHDPVPLKIDSDLPLADGE